jgi:hypothetical protein
MLVSSAFSANRCVLDNGLACSDSRYSFLTRSRGLVSSLAIAPKSFESAKLITRPLQINAPNPGLARCTDIKPAYQHPPTRFPPFARPPTALAASAKSPETSPTFEAASCTCPTGNCLAGNEPPKSRPKKSPKLQRHDLNLELPPFVPIHVSTRPQRQLFIRHHRQDPLPFLLRIAFDLRARHVQITFVFRSASP